MLKYIVTVFEKGTEDKIAQVKCMPDDLFEVLDRFKSIGVVKAFVVDDDESEVK